MREDSLTGDIVKAASSSDEELLVKSFEFKRKRNELLFFLKPECFLVESIDHTERILKMVLEQFRKYDVDVSGILLLRGKRLEELGIMDRHYGFINRLSRNASQITSDAEAAKIQEGLEITDIGKHRILGGHEFLQEFSRFDEESLDKFWATKESLKLRSGFYVQKYSVENQDIVLVNGFHPAQLRHFTDPSHRIVVLLLHSDTDWKALKNDLVGNTFPEKAKHDSIRSIMFKEGDKYGIPSVSISNNCVHLSAGPFEGLFEIDNFLQGVEAARFRLQETLVSRLMIERRLSDKDVVRCMQNPTARVDEKETDLFTFTEEKDSQEAIYDYTKCFV